MIERAVRISELPGRGYDARMLRPERNDGARSATGRRAISFFFFFFFFFAKRENLEIYDRVGGGDRCIGD